MTTKNFKTLHTWDTVHSADSVEWCPISPYKNFFTCGTYQLIQSNNANVESPDKEESVREGSIILFKVNKDKLEVKQSISCPAILDMKWSCKEVSGNIALAAANAVGEVCVFYLQDGLLNFITKCVLKRFSGDYLILSLDWIKTDSPDLICSSDSQGNINLIKFREGSLEILKKWNAHSLEAWITSFDSFNVNIIYTGGDEAEMKVWDCRCEDVVKAASSAEHKAGVTALNSNIFKENKLVSGSYDETVLFWDSRNWKAPIGKIIASGGIWRLKWEPRSTCRYLLSACIYGGFQIYDVNALTVKAEYKEHKSLAYGADWCFYNENELKNLLDLDAFSMLATCSFYDHKLCVSLWDENLFKDE